MNTLLLMATITHCYVGCNTGAPDQQSLHVLACDTETGSAKIIQTVRGIQGTTYFQLDAAERFLYTAIGEERKDERRGTLVRFALDNGRIGEMERLAVLPCETPCHISLTPDGRRIAFAAYTSATAGTLDIADRTLRTYAFPNDAMGPNAKRQQKAYAHQTFHLPDGSMGVVDLGCDRIRLFDPATMVPREGQDIPALPGDGPRHAIFSKDKRFLFVLNELGSTVTSFQCTKNGFARVGEWSMLPAHFDRWESDHATLATKAAAIKLTADGKILMASNRGHDSIAFYAVNGEGTLTLRNIAKLTGRFPRDFALMPGEKFMVVGHKMSNEIQVYRLDRASCTLTPVGNPLPVWRPLCFVFAQH